MVMFPLAFTTTFGGGLLLLLFRRGAVMWRICGLGRCSSSGMTSHWLALVSRRRGSGSAVILLRLQRSLPLLRTDTRRRVFCMGGSGRRRRALTLDMDLRLLLPLKITVLAVAVVVHTVCGRMLWLL
jgi:hypothetical protein